jgi:hypothetical protein
MSNGLHNGLINGVHHGMHGETFSSYDLDAKTFLIAAGITNPLHKIAINYLVIDLKYFGIWNKFQAIYPFVGGNSISHSFNLKDINKFKLTFFNSPLHNSNGIKYNGTNQYAKTGYIASVSQAVKMNMHMSIYSRTSASGAAVEMGSLNGNWTRLYIVSNVATSRFSVNDYDTNLISTPNVSGLFLGSSTPTGGVATLYRNGTSISSYSPTNGTQPFNTTEYYIGCENNNGTAQDFTDKNHAFATIGSYLNATEALNYYIAVQRFQTTLNRQV